MKKQGFTLIELMVVVVIIGILAAVAVPKLFGMIAKSKASEVGPAAGEYVKLQEAYAMENNSLGLWKDIGYKSPAGNSTGDASTTNFKYSAPTAANAAQLAAGFTAENIVGLNDCAKNGGKWIVASEVNASNGNVVSQAKVTGANCVELTPSFEKISTGSISGSTSGNTSGDSGT